MKNRKRIFVLLMLFSQFIIYAKSDLKPDTVFKDCRIVLIKENITRNQYLSKNDLTISFKDDKHFIKENNKYNLGNKDKHIVLQDTSTEDNPDYVSYKYIGCERDHSLYLFSVFYYEISKSYLISSDYNSKIEFFGDPKLSPSKKYLVNSSEIVNYDPIPNLIQFWFISNGQFIQIFNYYPVNWTTKDIKWVNNNTVYFIQKMTNCNNINYCKITIIELKNRLLCP